MSGLSRTLIAAVVAVGAVFGVTQITSGSTNSTKESVFVGIVPARLLDTRENQTTFDGFDQAVGRLDAGTTYELDIAGRAGVPTDALSVTANLVAVNPSSPGHLTVYPCSVDRPNASALNYMPGVNNANEFSVPLGPYGDICIYTHAETDIVVDIYGYYIAGSGGTGEQGPAGQDGADGQDAESPARVIWVADDGTGDYELLSAALASITDASATKPYVIKMAPGVYTEEENVPMKNYVDVEGSGQGITTIKCECSGSDSDDSVSGSTISIGEVNTEIRQITIENTGSPFGNAIHSNQNSNLTWSVSIADVTTKATGATTRATGIDAKNSTLKLRNVTASAQGATFNYGIKSNNSFVTIETAKATASGGPGSGLGINTGILIEQALELGAQLNNVIGEAACDNCAETTGVHASNARLIANNTTATAQGSELATGIKLEISSVADISNSSAFGSEADENIGISVKSGTSATVNDISATGSSTAGLASYGIEVVGNSGISTLNAFNTKAVGEAGNAGVAAIVDGNGTTASFTNSVLDGESLNSGKSIRLVEGGAAKVINTRFEPQTVEGSGDLDCLNTYYLDLTEADNDCL